MAETIRAPYMTCGCGASVLVDTAELKKHLASPEHQDRKRQKEAGQTEIPVPDQPPPRMYPANAPLDRIVFGMSRKCPRCHGTWGKRAEANGYIPDPEKGSKRCVRCNGWGIVPNVGL